MCSLLPVFTVYWYHSASKHWQNDTECVFESNQIKSNRTEKACISSFSFLHFNKNISMSQPKAGTRHYKKHVFIEKH